MSSIQQSSYQSAIIWPQDYIPGTTDNFSSNEMIVSGLNSNEIWKLLEDTSKWESYYSNVSNISFYNGGGPKLEINSRFRFNTFGFPIEAQVTQCVYPSNGIAGRLSWHGWAEGDSETRLDVNHAWLIEDLPGGRVRILTQESQKGKPAKKLASTVPNPMINGHQEWITGLINSCKKNKLPSE
ncbi:hypothetical protein ACTFIW_006676 [Dictyostelium discoideum]